MIFKEEQKVLLSQKKKRKSPTFKCKMQISRRGGEPSVLFRKKKRRVGQLFFNESGRWIIITW